MPRSFLPSPSLLVNRVMRRVFGALGVALLALTLLLWPQMGSAQELPPDRAETLQGYAQKLHPTLMRRLLDEDASPDEFIPIIVEWARDTDRVLATAALIPDLADRRVQVVEMLQADAARNSAALRSEIDQGVQAGLAVEVKAFWASPIVAMSARPALIEQLIQRADVVQIRPDGRFRLEADPVVEAPAPANPQEAQALQWNLNMVNTDLAQSALGLDGTGAVVAIMDSGVDWQHSVLINQYRGYNPKGPAIHAGNWYAATDEPYVYPGDGFGHGTHVAGIIVGDDHNGIRTGVAPGAQWIAVKIFDNFGFTEESWIHDGFQWLMAPNGDPTLAPDVVNSSWGSNDIYEDLFRPDVQALRSAGILPIFSAGNNGPSGQTTSTPGSFPESLAVGAVDQDRYPASFSARGPSIWDEIKPEVAAPGVSIYSSYLGGGFAFLNGTSMAAPHVTGLAAMLIQADPDLNPDQLEEIIVETATPLGSEIPNNSTGWGLINAYAAGLRVTQSGELKGQVTRAVGGAVAYPTITATPRSGEQAVTVLGDAAGAFTVALRPGLYDVSAQAFGFVSTTVYAQMIQTGTVTTVPISLTLRPVGTIFGRVTEADSAIPLSASIIVSGTPVRTQSDGNNGTFSLALPQGNWDLRIEAPGHRISRTTVAVTVGQGVEINPVLTEVPTILLVDAGRWYYYSRAQYFMDSLAALDYPVDVYTIRNPYAGLSIPTDTPELADLQPYDLVIWSAPLDSPGYINAEFVIQDYLWAGGRLIMSGEDIAYWDGGGNPFSIATYFPDTLGIWFQQEETISTLTGAPLSPLDSFSMTLNIKEPPTRQYVVDAVTVNKPKRAQPLMLWPDGSNGAVTSGTCTPFRAVWMGFGLEGTSQTQDRTEVLDRLIDWTQEPPAKQGILISETPAPAVGFGGDTVTHTFSVDSVGIEDGIYDIQIQGPTGGEMWPISLYIVDTVRGTRTPVGPETPLTLAACGERDLVAEVILPADLVRNERGYHIIRLTNQADPTVSGAITLTSKSPAPILLVDDERFYDNEDRYAQALDGMPVSFDLFTASNDQSPSLDLLYRYPAVIWFTGYDWFLPLTANEQEQLGTYLDTGGRLLLSSQDVLDIYGANDFVKDYLGVRQPMWTITSTDVAPTTDSPLGQDIGPFLLDYPIPNWSDGLLLAEHAQAGLVDQQGYTVASLSRGDRWRSAFFPFPLESMDPADLRLLLGRTLTWLGPFNGSRLDVPDLAKPGERIPISLTLTTQEVTPQTGVVVSLPLPDQVNVVADSVQGGWRYDAESRALTWAGTLHLDTPRRLQATVEILADLPEHTRLTFSARMEAKDSFVAAAEDSTWVNSPWLTLSKVAWPPKSAASETIVYTLTLSNQGQIPAQSTVADTLPADVTLINDTIQASLGTVKVTTTEDARTTLDWQSALDVDEQATLSFSVQITHTLSGAPIYNWAAATEQGGQRWGDAAIVIIPTDIYLPYVAR